MSRLFFVNRKLLVTTCLLCSRDLLLSQVISPSTITVQDRRPLAKAIMELQRYVTVPINYEDAPYQYGPEIADVTGAVSRPSVTAAHPGFRMLVPHGGSLSFSFNKLMGTSETATDPNSAVAAVVAAYNNTGMGGEYQMTKANGQYYVFPAFRRDSNGVRIPA